MRIYPALLIVALMWVGVSPRADGQTDRPGPPQGGDGGGRRDRGGFDRQPGMPGGGGGRPFFGGGPGGGESGRPNFRGMMGDPNQFFDMMAQGKDVITRNDVQPMFQGMFDRMAERMGITNGQITRQQFVSSMQQRMAGGGGPGGGAPGGGPQGGMGGPGGRADPSAWADNMFRRLDQNGDGLLNYDEMPEALRIEREKWDTNRDGFIDLTEYKAYFQARIQQMQQERGGMGFIPSGPTQDEEEEKKPVVYRSGKLPKELPSWFAELDEDEDAQIGVYEWRKSGRSLAEFAKMDRNGDGFLTVDEVLRFTTQNNEGSSEGGAPSTGGGRPSFFAGGASPGNGEGGGGNRFPGMPGGGRGGWPGMQPGGMPPRGFGNGGMPGMGGDRSGGGGNRWNRGQPGNSDRPKGERRSNSNGRDTRGPG